LGEAISGEVHNGVSHGFGGNCVEMVAIIDLPMTVAKASQPDFVDEFGRRQGRRTTLATQRPKRNLVQLGKDLSKHGIGDLAVTVREEAELLGK
jgi:hypothetical protein